jgi:hypothetical protein
LSCLNIFIVSDSVGFWRRVISNLLRNAKPFSDLTREIATNDRPAEKSERPSSMTACSKVRPWLLWMVMPQAMVRGSCVRESSFPDLFSQRAMDGTMGTHDGSMPSHPGLSGPNIMSRVQYSLKSLKWSYLYTHWTWQRQLLEDDCRDWSPGETIFFWRYPGHH